jgi:hypothetical protein
VHRYPTLALTLLLLSPLANAATLDFNLNNHTLRANLAGKVSPAFSGLTGEIGILHHETGDNLFHAGINVAGDNWSRHGTFNISMGLRAVTGSVEIKHHDYAVRALGVGGQMRFNPAHRFGMGAYGYYAPKVTSFGDTERYGEAGLRLDYLVIPQAYAYIGYRRLGLTLSQDNHNEFNHDLTPGDYFHVGMQLIF